MGLLVKKSASNNMLRKTLLLLLYIHLSMSCVTQIFEMLFNHPTPSPTPPPTPPPPPPPPPPSPTAAPGPCTCGGTNRVSKIVGGIPTEENEYPWQVGLLRSQSDSTPFCGGSLLSSKTVLTAAHCTVGGDANYVLLGEHDVTAQDGEMKVRVCERKEHFDYKSNNQDNDFAILTLCEDVPFETDIKPACLPPTNTLASGGFQPSVLHEVTVTTMSNPACAGWNTAYSPSQILPSMICASGTNKDFCQGDSGGPLVVPESTGYYTLVGVVSWGYGCAQADAPGVYSRVTSVLGWINENVQGSTCPVPT